MSVETAYRRWKALLWLLLVTFFLYQGWKDFQIIVSNAGLYLTGKPTFVDSMGILTMPRTPANVVYLVLGLLTLALLVASIISWFVYRITNSRHAEFRSATRDELVRLNWLRAFRFAFVCTLAAIVLGSAVDYAVSLLMNAQRPVGPIWYGEFWTKLLPTLYLLVAVGSLLGSFLCMDREHAAS
jgi:hypothetical protein